MGIDRVFVDESDLYKNLGFTSKMTRIAGLPNTESNRALDMYMKTRYLAERNGGIVFATGTPISNTMAEMYTLQRYLAPETLKAAGVEHFDAWAANFGEAVTSLELAPDGSGYRMHTRFAKFVNLPELLSMFRSFADVQTADMLHLPRPAIQGGKPHITAAPGSPELKAYRRDAGEPRAEAPHIEDRSLGRQHAQDHRRRQKGRARYAPGRSLRRAGRYQGQPRHRKDSQHMGGRKRKAIDAACLLRPLDAQSRPLQRL